MRMTTKLRGLKYQAAQARLTLGMAEHETFWVVQGYDDGEELLTSTAITTEQYDTKRGHINIVWTSLAPAFLKVVTEYRLRSAVTLTEYHAQCDSASESLICDREGIPIGVNGHASFRIIDDEDEDIGRRPGSGVESVTISSPGWSPVTLVAKGNE